MLATKIKGSFQGYENGQKNDCPLPRKSQPLFSVFLFLFFLFKINIF